MPAVAVTTGGVRSPAGRDVDVSAPRRMIGCIGLVEVADVPVGPKGLGNVVVGPAIPVRVARRVFKVAEISRLTGLVGAGRGLRRFVR